MDSKSFGAIVLALTVVGAGDRQVTPADSQIQRLASAAGRVIEADVDHGVAGVEVELQHEDGGIRRTTTALDGSFHIDKLPSGRFHFTARKAGFVPGSYGQLWPEGPQAVIPVSAGESLQGLEIRLWRYGSIAGRVEDRAGESVPKVRVHALRRHWIGGRLLLDRTTEDSTDDRGAYRLSELVPGEYLVSVPSSRTTMWGRSADALDRTGAGIRLGSLSVVQSNGLPADVAGTGRLAIYPPTFYSGSATAANATRLTLESGQQLEAIDMRLEATDAFTVAGHIVDRLDTPVSYAPIYLVAAEDALASDIFTDVATTVSRPDGSFSLVGVPAGVYGLRTIRIPSARPMFSEDVAMSSAFMFARSANELAANPPRRVGPPPEEPTLWAQQTIVVDKDHQSVRIVATAVPRVSGRLLFEGPEPKPRETELAALSVVLHPVDHPVITQIFPDRVSRTGTFTTFGAPPGRYFPSVLGDLTGWNLESITFGGQNVTDMWLELGSGAPSELVFTFSRHRSGGIRGTVSDRQGRPNAEALVVAFPQDRGQRTHVGPKPRRIRAAMTSGQGVYDLQGLPAGDYLVAAVTGPEARNWEQAAFLERLSREAAAVRIGRSETQVVNLVLSGR